ncbi:MULTISPECIES: DUF742 domain-containing protein [Streptomyces]|uniref:DUF742 domain-containing protein n=1 Tax=Streptomyces TaxID=1883 RepID=UPI00073DDA0E|nr:DUF742 domain-containing protein [Streptomyces sp. EAS-AB2608]MYU31148.1 DUF742 domain-containing protein [Streptomyces sp. SID7810]BCM70555.1 hypothetical protein EASAB2608_05889 [Streptomyces sp. EAS-AB2608]CUW32250.1 hypothetical protein TUE45_06999 [Streptomyces reticuli]
MTANDSTAGQPEEFVRTYTLTGGRTRARHLLSLDTVLEPGSGRPGPGQPPECQEIVALCREHRRSVTELAGRLGRPVTAVKILISDLLDARGLTIPISGPYAASDQEADPRPSTQLLVAAMAGLRREFPDAVSYLQAG